MYVEKSQLIQNRNKQGILSELEKLANLYGQNVHGCDVANTEGETITQQIGYMVELGWNTYQHQFTNPSADRMIETHRNTHGGDKWGKCNSETELKILECRSNARVANAQEGR